jgi:predicted nucleic acid-binding protein
MITIDTNVAVYALSQEPKREIARELLVTSDFASVQVLNEYVHTARRKFRRDWDQIDADIKLLHSTIGVFFPITDDDHATGLRLAARYKLAFYDALLLAVALVGGATSIYSEDMQHDLVIDDRLTIINPFLDAP